MTGIDALARRGKPLALAGVFIIVAAGRWYNLSVVHLQPLRFALEWAIVYGAAFGFVFYHMVDLFLARGLLQPKIVWTEGLSVYLLALIACNRLLLQGRAHTSFTIFLVELSVTLGIGITSVVADLKLSGREDHLLATDSTLPRRYLRRRLIGTVLESFFRLFPRPEPVGLYRIGNPDESSMVIVSGNYDLTVRRVARSLRGISCWLLVCDSRGINIWCSSLANHFNTDKVVRAIKQSGLGEIVKHRRLILPELCAANVSLKEIRRRTGFSSRFGPVRIEDFAEYLSNPSNTGIRRVRFPIRSRLEMATGTLFLPAVFTLFVFNFIDPDMLLVILPAFYVMSLLNALTFPYRFVAGVRMWSLLFGSVAFLFVWALCAFVLKVDWLVYSVTFGVAGVYFVNEFEGWSPLVKFSVTKAYTSAQIGISADRCTGCGTCVDVCPKGVYSVVNNISTAIDPDACSSCKSCFVQCPAGAISHSAERVNEAFI